MSENIHCPIFPSVTLNKYGVCPREYLCRATPHYEPCPPTDLSSFYAKLLDSWRRRYYLKRPKPRVYTMFVNKLMAPRCQAVRQQARERAKALGVGRMNKKNSKKNSGENSSTGAAKKDEKHVTIDRRNEVKVNGDSVFAAMKTIKGDVTSTVLRDHFKLDKESGRGKIRGIMKKLQKDKKVNIVEKAGVKRKQFVYVVA